VYFSLRYSFLPAIAAILKVRKLHASESKSVSTIDARDLGVQAFPDEAPVVSVSGISALSSCSFAGIAPELSGVYYLHFSGFPLNVL
jgi:hypothetical protein